MRASVSIAFVAVVAVAVFAVAQAPVPGPLLGGGGSGGGGSPTGAAGGDLSGTYPNPSTAKLNGATVTYTSPAAGDSLVLTGAAAIGNGRPGLPTRAVSGNTDTLSCVNSPIFDPAVGHNGDNGGVAEYSYAGVTTVTVPTAGTAACPVSTVIWVSNANTVAANSVSLTGGFTGTVLANSSCRLRIDASSTWSMFCGYKSAQGASGKPAMADDAFSGGAGTPVCVQATGGVGTTGCVVATTFLMPFGSATITPGAASTSYMGLYDNTTEAKVAYPMARAGTATGISCAVNAAPTTGQTFVYTLRINLADPASQITCTISGTATACNGSGANAWTVNQQVDIKLVTSASATATNHHCTMLYQ